MRKSLLVAALMAAVSPLYMSDETAATGWAEDPNAGASPADGAPGSDTASSAPTANTDGSAGTAVEGEVGNVNAASGSTDTSNISPATDATLTGGDATPAVPVVAEVPADTAPVGSTFVPLDPPVTLLNTAALAPTNDDTGKVEIVADSHTEAKERFAGVMAKLHQFEGDSVDDLRLELRVIGTLLHLHSAASSSADATGDYKSSDL